MASAAVRRYWSRVAELGCVCCGMPAEIAHCHGGSMIPLIGPHAKGKKLARLDWLILPICPFHHREEYGGLDAGVLRWEAEYGPQVQHLVMVSIKLQVDIFANAGIALTR